MKRKHIIIVVAVIIGLIYLYVIALGYDGGKAARPVKPTKEIISLKKEIQKEVNSESVSIRSPRNYELDNCNKHGFQQQYLQIHIDNDLLKNNEALKNYATSVNKRLQKIFPYDKNCYDSVIIKAQYFDKFMDSTINKRYSFPMIK